MKRTLLVALLATVPAAAQEDVRFQNVTGTTISTDLDAMRRTPEAFKSLWVTFEAQFCSMGRISNPFFTEFVPSDFANFYAWSGDQPIWRKESYDDLFGMLFMHKDNPELKKIYTLKLYDRVQIQGVVRNVFQDAPWVEVMSITPVGAKVDTPTLAHLYRAEAHMQRREWNRAIAELSMAPAGGKPQHVVNAVNKNLGVCYLRIGEAEKAQTYLSMAATGDADDREATQLARVAKENPRLEIDVDVDRTSVTDAGRPMWEAFDDGRSSSQARTQAAKPQR